VPDFVAEVGDCEREALASFSGTAPDQPPLGGRQHRLG
jgi:hypothetical protein